MLYVATSRYTLYQYRRVARSLQGLWRVLLISQKHEVICDWSRRFYRSTESVQDRKWQPQGFVGVRAWPVQDDCRSRLRSPHQGPVRYPDWQRWPRPRCLQFYQCWGRRASWSGARARRRAPAHAAGRRSSGA